jgi:hypothetical protein
MSGGGDGSDRQGKATRSIRDVVEPHIRTLIAALFAFLSVTVAAYFVGISTPFKVIAAALAIVGLVALTIWMTDPWARWREDARRRLLFVGFPLLGAAVVIVIGLVAQPSQIAYDRPAHLILLDVSTGMNEPFDENLTKLEAARNGITQHVTDFGANLQQGLAIYGAGGCEPSESFENLVPLGPSRTGAIEDAASGVTGGGEAALVSAGIQALNELDKFKNENRKVTLIAGALQDGCGRDVRDLQDRASQLGVAVEWDLIGLGFTDEDKDAAESLPDTNLEFVETRDELDSVLEEYLFLKVVQDGLEEMRTYIDQARIPLNEAGEAVSAQENDVARQKVAAAQAGANEGKDRFAQIADGDGKESLNKIADMFADQMTLLQEQAVPKMEKVIEVSVDSETAGAEGQSEELQEAISDYNAVIGEYNSARRDISDEIERLLNDAFAPQATPSLGPS